MKTSLILLFFFFVFFGVEAQKNHNGLKLHRTVSSFGKVEFWISRVDTFLVTNTTNSTIYILKQIVPRGFELRTPLMGIEPGKTEAIEVIYNPNKLGKFNKKLKLYHSGAIQPFYIEFKGEVLGFDEYSKVSCPSFSTPNYQKPNFDMQITVIDSLTQKPIKKALIELSKGEDFHQFYTDGQGVIKRKSHLGLFFIYTEAEGYYSKQVEHYFNPKRRSITITMISKEKPIELLDKIELELPEITLDDRKEDNIEKEEFEYIPHKSIPIVEENDEFPLSKYRENNVVFLIDVSGSMRGRDRLDLLKKSMIQLTYMLRSVDRVTIITYSDETQVVLPATSAKQKEKIIKVIEDLRASGSTFGGKAIRKAYKVLKEEYLADGNNQIILATDGGFNGLGKGEKQLLRLAKNKSDQGFNFSTLGFGKNRRGKDLIEKISISGGGNYLYIKTEEQAKVDLNKMIMSQSVIQK